MLRQKLVIDNMAQMPTKKEKDKQKKINNFVLATYLIFFSKLFYVKNGRGRVRFPNPHARNNCINFRVNSGYKNQTYPGRIS